MKLLSILGIRGTRGKAKNSYGGAAYSFYVPSMLLNYKQRSYVDDSASKQKLEQELTHNRR